MIIFVIEMVSSLVSLVVLSLMQGTCWGYFADWSQLARDKQPTCVDIPANMTLCHNIGEITITHQHDGSLSAT